MRQKNQYKKQEFGDFQTPYELTQKISRLLKNLDINPQSIIEPTCGKGNFILSALNTFDELQSCIGVEINSAHLQELSNNLTHHQKSSIVNLINDSFFELDWNQILEAIPKPFLILGNPP
ncbi:MAG: N-6 DNA methylase [Xenococcaceae cyanobacterium MO_167.B27]|nr:N-6 DNA methylase [Xenococcaceae cyanobacterium MO_167.B27]